MITKTNELTIPPQKQQGSVLTVSLFILLVITIVGATALNDTVMEEKMSSNFQNGHAAFQAAESSVNRTVLAIANDDLAQAALAAKEEADINGTDPEWPTMEEHVMERSVAGSNENAQSSTTLNSTVQFVDINTFPAGGCTLNTGSGNNCMAAVVDVIATGTVTGTNVTRTHRQGAEKLMPGG